MKILITGITGTIGSFLAPELARDHDVYGIDLLPSDWPNSTQADLCDPGALPPVFEGMDVVIHLAADPRHEVEIGWDELTNPNLIATARNVRRCPRRRCAPGSSSPVRCTLWAVMSLTSPTSLSFPAALTAWTPASIPLVKGDDPGRPDSPLRRHQDLRRVVGPLLHGGRQH